MLFTRITGEIFIHHYHHVREGLGAFPVP